MLWYDIFCRGGVLFALLLKLLCLNSVGADAEAARGVAAKDVRGTVKGTHYEVASWRPSMNSDSFDGRQGAEDVWRREVRRVTAMV
jgi:hypothetical protein